MSWCDPTMVQATNHTGNLSKKIQDVRRKLKTSLKGPLRTGRKKVPRPRCCFHCDQKFHSSFCRRLSLKNIRVRKLLPSKFECLTCRKRFKGIANFLLHRTLHNEFPQNEGTTDEIQRSIKTEHAPGLKQALELNEINSNTEPMVGESNNEFDLAIQSQQGEIEEGLPAPCRSNNKAIQPTGARKRKGKLQIQYISPDVISEAHSDEEEFNFMQSLVRDQKKVSDDNENPKVFIISNDADLGLHVNGILDDSGESIEHGSLYEDEAVNGNEDRRLRNHSSSFGEFHSCFCSGCQNDVQGGRHHHCFPHEHGPCHEDCVDNKCHNHNNKLNSCYRERGSDQCDKHSRSGHNHYNNCHTQCHAEPCGNDRVHKSHCHGSCCPRSDWHDMYKDDDGGRFRPKHAALFKELCNSMLTPEERRHAYNNEFDSYSHYMRNSSFSPRDPLPISYGHERTAASRRPNSRDESTSLKPAGSYNGMPGSHTNRKATDSDLAPLDAMALTNNVVGYSEGSARCMSNGGPLRKKDIFTAPGSAIRRMKELVSKYSDRHPKDGRGNLRIAVNKPIPTDYMEHEDAEMLDICHVDPILDSKSEAYVCHICGKEFAWAVTLKRHMHIHTGVRQYQCSICNKAFTRSHHLKRHMTVHTGEKPYVCHICNKAYSRSDRLSSHMSNHEGYVSNKRKGKGQVKPADTETNTADNSQHHAGSLAAVISGMEESISNASAFPPVLDTVANTVADAAKSCEPAAPETSLSSLGKLEVNVADKEEEAKGKSSRATILANPRSESPITEDTGIALSSQRSHDLSSYKGLKLPKEERDVIPSRFQIRPSDLGPPGIYVPSTYVMAGHNPAFIPGTLIDGASVERPSEIEMFSSHGLPVSGEPRSHSRRSPAASESFSYRSDSEIPKRSAFGSLMDVREEYAKNQRMGSVSMYLQEMQHNVNMRREAIGIEPMMHYASRDERAPIFNTDIHNPYIKMKMEEMPIDGSNHMSNLNEQNVGMHDEGHTNSHGANRNARRKPGPKTAHPQCSDPHSPEVNMFTFRNMVTKKELPRTFVCKTCNKSFTRSHHLRRHELIHSGHKPFKCTICGRAFNRSDHLNLHLATHYQSSNGKGKRKNFSQPMIGAVVAGEGESLVGGIHSVQEQPASFEHQQQHQPQAPATREKEGDHQGDDGDHATEVTPICENPPKNEITEDTF